ncbi:MAG: endolytic transglycosylase MltG [Thermodesulfobacteriota bacterium]
MLKFKKPNTILIIALFLMVALSSALFLDILIYGKSPGGEEIEPKTIIFYPKESFSSLVQKLHKEKLISSPLKFKLYARIKGYGKKILAGEYSFFSTMSPDQIMDIMIAGKVVLHRVTIPEGSTIRQIAEILSKADLISQSEFMEAAMDPGVILENCVEASSLEGYLFPDTYQFAKMTPARKIISTISKRFWSVFKAEWKKEAEKMGYSIHQIITLASIIEKESSIEDERAIVSSVFHNRLKKKMRLESDPTVIYGIRGFDGNLTRKHLSESTPYNTYRFSGLPPGPIANPGAGSIEAALFPAKTDFLYFVSKNDGSHLFSEDFARHKLAVSKYQPRKNRK